MLTRLRWLRSGSAAGVVLLLLTVHVQVAPAQSFGDIARQAAEGRTQVPAGRVYTNEDLPFVDPWVPPPAPIPVAPVGSAATTADTPAPGQAAEPANNPGVEPIVVKPREKRDEQYMRARAQELRRHLAKVTADIAATESRLAEIDAAPETPTLARESEVLAATLTRLQREEGFRSDELTRFVERALQVAKVPEAWVR